MCGEREGKGRIAGRRLLSPEAKDATVGTWLKQLASGANLKGEIGKFQEKMLHTNEDLLV